MAKASLFFSGRDTYGRTVDAAQREDGIWFSRYQCFNGYGVGMTKWRKDKDLSSLIRDDNRLDWGFQKLDAGNPKGLRLPNKVN
jgi:hypothetical protein